MRVALLLVLAAAPAFAEAPIRPVIDDTRCATPPAVKPVGFRHKRSKLVAKLGSANHRGIDVVAAEDDLVQIVEGKLARGKADKDLEHEDAELFACIDNVWKSLGVHRTNDEGRLYLTLGGTARLPVGMRDMYIASVADGSGAYFLGYVAPRGTKVVVTDVDGTISWSENAIVKTAISRDHDIGYRPNAPAAFTALPYPVIYTTARGDVFVNITRQWLHRHGFPRGPLRLARGSFAKPGKAAIAYKTNTLKSISIPIAAGVGNRKSDITAYSAIGLTGKQILIHLPEHEDEVRRDLDAGNATGFHDYRDLFKLVAQP